MRKNSSNSNLKEEIIGPHSRKIEIEHEIGEQIFIQTLTVPRRRSFKNIYQFMLTLLGTDPRSGEESRSLKATHSMIFMWPHRMSWGGWTIISTTSKSLSKEI